MCTALHYLLQKAKLQIHSSVGLDIVNVTPGSGAVEFQYATRSVLFHTLNAEPSRQLVENYRRGGAAG